MAGDAPLLLADRVSKRFGELAALTDISLAFHAGEIHAVLGENGAGKSTLMGVLAGFVRPTSGAVIYDGRPLPVGQAFQCRRMGIEMIHQHFTLVDDFTVAENLALAHLPSLGVLAHIERRAKASLDAAQRLAWPIDADARVRDLPVGAKQRVEILKALGGEARVLILDEPTAVLSQNEVVDLFRVLRQLRDEGRVVILIAHKLSEVLAVADRISVLRRGRLVAGVPRREASAEILAKWMIGELPVRSSQTVVPPRAETALEIDDLHVRGSRGEEAVRGVSFAVRHGEILGIGGVDGNGQVELAEAIAQIRSGEWPLKEPNPRDIGYIPQDRQGDGLAADMTIQENMLVGALDRSAFRRGPFLRKGQIAKWARGLVERFDIRTDSPLRPVRDLSGGNQQKVVVGRVLDGEPKILVAANPTRGLDFQAAQFVHDQIRGARNRGAAVVLFSTDIDELFALSDRQYFMSRGQLFDGSNAQAYVGDPQGSAG